MVRNLEIVVKFWVTKFFLDLRQVKFLMELEQDECADKCRKQLKNHFITDSKFKRHSFSIEPDRDFV